MLLPNVMATKLSEGRCRLPLDGHQEGPANAAGRGGSAELQPLRIPIQPPMVVPSGSRTDVLPSPGVTSIPSKMKTSGWWPKSDETSIPFGRSWCAEAQGHSASRRSRRTCAKAPRSRSCRRSATLRYRWRAASPAGRRPCGTPARPAERIHAVCRWHPGGSKIGHRSQSVRTRSGPRQHGAHVVCGSCVTGTGPASAGVGGPLNGGGEP